jgi:excisionase family DNA binding protein
MNATSRFITIRQFMQRFQLSRSTAYRLISAGKIITVKIGRAVRIPVQSADSWAQGLLADNDNAG